MSISLRIRRCGYLPSATRARTSGGLRHTPSSSSSRVMRPASSMTASWDRTPDGRHDSLVIEANRRPIRLLRTRIQRDERAVRGRSLKRSGGSRHSRVVNHDVRWVVRLGAPTRLALLCLISRPSWMPPAMTATKPAEKSRTRSQISASGMKSAGAAKMNVAATKYQTAVLGVSLVLCDEFMVSLPSHHATRATGARPPPSGGHLVDSSRRKRTSVEVGCSIHLRDESCGAEPPVGGLP